LEATGAGGRHLHTNCLIHCPVVADQEVGVALGSVGIGQCGFCGAGNTFSNPILTGIRWAFLAAFFGLTATGLFSYLRNSRSVAQAELYTAVNIYLLLGLLWAAIYLAKMLFLRVQSRLEVTQPTVRPSWFISA
jgi:hypothetical protein